MVGPRTACWWELTAIPALVHAARYTVFRLVDQAWLYPNVSFSLAGLTAFVTSFPFAAFLLGLVLAIRLIRMPEGEMARVGVGGPRGRKVRLPTCETHYELRTWDDDPDDETAREIVVMCHGFSGDCGQLASLADEVHAAGYVVLTYDLVGRGYSSCRGMPHTAELFVSQLAELLYSLKILRPAHFVGVSLGGGVCVEFSRFYPDRVASLALVAPVGLPLSTSAHVLTKIPLVPDVMFRCALWRTVVAGLELEWADETNPQLAAMAASYRDRVDNEPAFGRSLLSTARHFPLEGLEHSFRRLGDAAIATRGARAASTSSASGSGGEPVLLHLPTGKKGDSASAGASSDGEIPVLLVWGDDDRTCPIANAYDIRKRLVPRARLVVIRGARHCVYSEFAKDVGEAILGFLNADSSGHRGTKTTPAVVSDDDDEATSVSLADTATTAAEADAPPLPEDTTAKTANSPRTMTSPASLLRYWGLVGPPPALLSSATDPGTWFASAGGSSGTRATT
eukprot:CAMPEP_0185705544 /NCGR_PEP_ID=MMETSP1164-20130828/20071_1 /TAXON_ID=1104430 /ORGANISM="Chrysoreinhardia sp, Strain CCMP2950" /LENGTH=509 /DNA_ID=CAMNT_0028372929 /DNA_START=1 /DNA_END=1533 /DNA_ORIENTATION=+